MMGFAIYTIGQKLRLYSGLFIDSLHWQKEFCIG